MTGRLPYNPETSYQLLDLHRAGVRVKPCDLRPGLPVAAQAVILKALSFAQKERYVRAKDFGEALAQALTAEAEENLLVEPPEKLHGSATRRLLQARSPLFWLIALVIVSALGLGVRQFVQSRTGSTTNNPQVSSVTAPVRQLSYWLTVQRDRKRYPDSKPFILPREVIFSEDDQVRLHISSPQTGYLYIINEGPNQTNNLPEYNVLFPDTRTNGGSAAIQAQQTIQIPQPSNKPEQDWFVFDRQEGVEKIWLIWSAQSIAPLEAVKRWANPKDKGEIGDPNQIKVVAEYLSKESANPPQVEKDEAAKQTSLKSGREVLVGLVKLEHH